MAATDSKFKQKDTSNTKIEEIIDKIKNRLLHDNCRLVDLFPEFKRSCCGDAKCKCTTKNELVSTLKKQDFGFSSRQAEAFASFLCDGGLKGQHVPLVCLKRAIHRHRRDSLCRLSSEDETESVVGGRGEEQFPSWLTERKDFQNFFPRYAQDDDKEDLVLVRMALRKSFRLKRDLWLISNWATSCPAFKKLMEMCEEGDRASMAQAFEYLELKNNEVLFRQGDAGDAFYTILKGKVEVLVEGQGRVVTYGPLESFGERSLENSAPRAGTVRCIADCELIRITAARYHSLKAKLKADREDKAVMSLNKNWKPPFSWKFTKLQHLARQATHKSFNPLQQNTHPDKMVEPDAAENRKIIFTEGDASDGSFYILISGKCVAKRHITEEKITRWPASKTQDELTLNVQSKQVTVKTLEPGEIFGEDAWMGIARRGYTVEVMEEGAEMITMCKEEFDKLMTTVESQAFADHITTLRNDLYKSADFFHLPLIKASLEKKKIEKLKRESFGPSYSSKKEAEENQKNKKNSGFPPLFKGKSNSFRISQLPSHQNASPIGNKKEKDKLPVFLTSRGTRLSAQAVLQAVNSTKNSSHESARASSRKIVLEYTKQGEIKPKFAPFCLISEENLANSKAVHSVPNLPPRNSRRSRAGTYDASLIRPSGVVRERRCRGGNKSAIGICMT